MSEMPKYWMMFDVESVGLHGEAFAVAYVVLDEHGLEVQSRVLSCLPAKARGNSGDHEWVKNHVPKLPENCASPAEVRAEFWKRWMMWREMRAVLVADCAWPVEARFLIACVEDNATDRNWHGPYPLHDLASMLQSHGISPMNSCPRRPDELPEHHPLMDARVSARQLRELLQRPMSRGALMTPAAEVAP